MASQGGKDTAIVKEKNSITGGIRKIAHLRNQMHVHLIFFMIFPVLCSVREILFGVMDFYDNDHKRGCVDLGSKKDDHMLCRSEVCRQDWLSRLVVASASAKRVS